MIAWHKTYSTVHFYLLT